MVGQQRVPCSDNRSSGSNPIHPAKREPHAASGCQSSRKPATGGRNSGVVVLSSLCAVALVGSVALAVLYYHESANKLEWNNLLSDYQNISDRYLRSTEENQELRAEGRKLREHNARLVEQTQHLNRSFTRRTSANHGLASERAQLQETITNLTSTVEKIRQDHRRLVHYTAELEIQNRNVSRSMASLKDAQTELEGENRNLTATERFLRVELLIARRSNRELAELNGRYGGEIQNLTGRLEARDSPRADCEGASGDDELLRETVAGLQEEAENLSYLLEQERRDAAGREESRREEVDSMLEDMRAVNQAYRSLDLYCPVVSQETEERICKTCQSGWTPFLTKCYYFSSRMLPWTASRAWCQTQGGDLVVVNSKQEQAFISAGGRVLNWDKSRVWIGMSDAETEGRWLWVDGSPVTPELQFWLSRADTGAEPDDWKLSNPQGEDCGHLDTDETDLSSWMDGSCDAHYGWICEKNV